MERGSTGRYEVTRVGGEEVRAFIPNPLPPQPPLELSGPRQRQLERATLALGRLDSITTLLPDPQLFKENAARVQSGGRAAAAMLRVLEALRERPVLTLNEVSRRTGLSFPTATKGMAGLSNLGLSWPRARADW